MSRRRRSFLLVAGAVLVAYGISGGCFAQRLPAALSPEELRVIQQSPLPYSVAVVPWDAASAARRGQSSAAYNDAAFKWLVGSGAFTSVRLAGPDESQADLLATSTGAYCNTAIVPLFTILSLGVIPTIFTDRDCEGVVFHTRGSSSGGSNSVEVRYEQEGRVIMGWLAVPVGTLPGWIHGRALEHPRSRARARLAILAHLKALAALTSR